MPQRYWQHLRERRSLDEGEEERDPSRGTLRTTLRGITRGESAARENSSDDTSARNEWPFK
jgi:hypothetical protein